MYLLLDMLSAIGGAAVMFSLTLGLGAGLAARPVAPAASTSTAAPAAVADSGFAGRLVAALERAGPAAARHGVALAFAAEPGLAPRLPEAVLDSALDALLEGAIAAAPAGKVLLTASRRGGTVTVAVADDGAGFDVAARRAALRPTEAAVALQGGRIELVGTAGEGGTVRLLLPVPMAQPAAARAARAPAAEPPVAAPARETVAGSA